MLCREDMCEVAKEIKVDSIVDNDPSLLAEEGCAKMDHIINVPLSELYDFQNYPFRVSIGKEIQKLSESIERHGVLVPAIVRPKNGGYEIISGHRRKIASERALKENIPCIVRKCTDDEAIITMLEYNLQRELIYPSEKAFAHKMELAVTRRQRNISDMSDSEVETRRYKDNSLLEFNEMENSESCGQVYRVIRLVKLIPEILDMVDEGKIAMRPAVEISYLTKKEQQGLKCAMEMEDCTPSHAQAIRMRKLSKEKKLNENIILSIMQEVKPNQVKKLRISRTMVEPFFDHETSVEKMQDKIIEVLESWKKWEE